MYTVYITALVHIATKWNARAVGERDTGLRLTSTACHFEEATMRFYMQAWVSDGFPDTLVRGEDEVCA